ncbi:uncharacterized protein CELE_F52H3.11 [Caenorhabditis elegans]|uniref:Uncharacterized protein n=1 Tax=Caenorhabditis elegans TaxID=6239 RepID=A0A2K5ATR3_CAEEL|nr:Uncharacterized protein CELE_F52H3.11 [Caenorhabditis elegans]SPC47296.1 Uncharacterized protein CELE_F52H3.11 [Caenorhabditis elegans]|eukprot:NP_001348709.1 Uncharacterized protein CELE_F52H3.11 [Caenorhabditis elegans]
MVVCRESHVRSQ